MLAVAAALVAGEARALADAAAAVATLDVAQSLATVAEEQHWVRPVVDESSTLRIVGGRHPLVEHMLGAGTVRPERRAISTTRRGFVVLTGPNMAGKSTYLRQTARIVLLAQIGSYRARRRRDDRRLRPHLHAHRRPRRPQRRAVDVHGGDGRNRRDPAQATQRSLVILDEIGRGTSTYDGVSIAQAVVEYLHDAPQLNCRTLFATHFHELTVLADQLPRVRNARVEVVEDGETITFLHRIVPGGADRSYGVHVAKLAGVPGGVLVRARQLLAEQERNRPLGGASDRGSDQLTLSIATRDRIRS